MIDSDNELLGTFCENANIEPFNTTSNLLTLIFSSDDSITKSGFRASWRRIKITETSGMITSPNYPNLQTEGNLFQRVGVLNGPKGSRFQLTFVDIDLDCEHGYGRYYHKIYLFDGLPNTNSLFTGEYIAIIHGGNIITNKKHLSHTSRSNVVSVYFSIFDYGDYDYDYDYYHDYEDYYYSKKKKQRKQKKQSRRRCRDYKPESSFRGFRLYWKLLE